MILQANCNGILLNMYFILCYIQSQLKDGVAFEDLRAFTQLIESISDVEMALGMYMAAGASITAGTNHIV